MKEHYVYALLDPRKPGSYIYDSYHFEFEPFYVGMGINDRIDSHDKEARNLNRGRPTHKINKIRNIWSQKLSIIKIKIFVDLTYDEANDKESDLIAKIGTYTIIHGVNRGPLTNQIAGGRNGKQPSEDLRKYIGRRTHEALMANVEARQKISATHLGKKKSPAHTEKLRKHLMEKCSSPEKRRRTSERMKTRVVSQEERDKISKSVSEYVKSTIWITNDVRSKRILSTESIPLGWRRGRGKIKK